MNAEIIQLNDNGMPGSSELIELIVVPRSGELIELGDRFFEVVNVVHRFEAGRGHSVKAYVRFAKAPFQEPKSRFGFGGR